MIFLYFTILTLLLYLTYKWFNKDIVAPAFIFTFGFFFQAIWAILYSKKWELSLHLNTFLVLVIGIVTFILSSKLIYTYYDKKKKDKSYVELIYIKIDIWKKILFLVFSIVAGLVYLNFIVTSVGGKILDISNVSHYISEYDRLSKFTDSYIKIPFIIGNLRTLVVAVGYWFLFVTINNYVCSKKKELLCISIVVISSLVSMMNGSRTPLFFLLAAGISYLFVVTNIKNKHKCNKGRNKLVIGAAIFGLAFLLLFTTFAKFLGREVKNKPIDYLAIYCGAEIKNLDLFMQDSTPKNTKYFGTQTFKPIISSLGRKIGFKGYEEYKLDLPFRRVGEYNLGNVYTTFYPYMYDFGYAGLIILVAIMSIISQLIYTKIKYSKQKNYPSLWAIAYGVIFGCLILSFFSNKFYENIISTEFIKQLIIWFISIWFFCKFDINQLKSYIKDKFNNK